MVAAPQKCPRAEKIARAVVRRHERWSSYFRTPSISPVLDGIENIREPGANQPHWRHSAKRRHRGREMTLLKAGCRKALFGVWIGPCPRSKWSKRITHQWDGKHLRCFRQMLPDTISTLHSSLPLWFSDLMFSGDAERQNAGGSV
jgi:hypothetical protein